MLALKLIPHLLAWTGIVLVLLRGSSRRLPVALAAAAGFAAGVVAALVLFRSFSGSIPLAVIKTALGASFLLLWGVCVAVLYRSTERVAPKPRVGSFLDATFPAAAVALLAGVVAGAVCACRLPVSDGAGALLLPASLLVLAGCALLGAAFWTERRLPLSLTVAPSGVLAAVVALLLFSSSSMIRLDLFSPLSMKVMKGTHDFVHQFMESILIPDHLFVRSEIWGYIGLLFSNRVGFWGGLVIWFTPVLLLLLAIRLELLPKVSHIRQGAQRRKLIAAAMRERNLRLVVPALSLAVFVAAAYQSSYPTVEYWDPKPVQISANAAGEIFIPKKGDVDLEDGKLHKYLFNRGGRQARFFVLMTPSGKLTVDLDACAICKPDGYGQAEGMVLCYYCKTFIPLETVGKPGGCNPVPIAFAEKEDGVHIDGLTLINAWTSTVQSTTAKKEGGK